MKIAPSQTSSKENCEDTKGATRIRKRRSTDDRMTKEKSRNISRQNTT